MFAKDLSKKHFRHQDTKFSFINNCCLCLGAFVAILSGLSGLGFLPFQHRSDTAEKEPIPKQVKKRRRFGQAGAMGYAYPFYPVLINHADGLVKLVLAGKPEMGATDDGMDPVTTHLFQGVINDISQRS